ncbi:hypothetical protein K2173_017822 [Erythroxylum novogranatense]|uniref:Phytocyanin domain-containing protein n=1 Tax=Erythroxylum novogranatense TaxID=1862640 RepID=A0AAV8SLV8_9ROSI|nr:hypothetical protein K2173_017822 [Erythroxylum novogranatense]
MGRRSYMAFLAVIVASALFQSSIAQTNHVVGGNSGWTIPSGGSYSSWAANRKFSVGDTLVFNFQNGVHDVAQVSKADYDSCSTTNPILFVSTSPARITLNSTGEHYFLCNFTGHCSAGQKLMVNVIAASSSSPSPAPQPSSPVTPPASSPSQPPTSSVPSPSPASAPTPSSPPSPPAPSPAPSGSATTYTVLGSSGWTIPPNGAVAYRNWAANKNFKVGDVLLFNYGNGAHNVAEVTKAAYGSCSTTSPISLNTTPPTRITLKTSGEHFFICAFPGHCSAGQKLAINVSGTATAPGSSATPSPSSTPSPTSTTTPPPPGNSAPSHLGNRGLFATIFTSFVVALLY